jgi:ABC-type branched-subunit amino acid transport system substrate-binding protein
MQKAGHRIPIGILFSTLGPYGTIGRELRDGALLGLDMANARADGAFRLEPCVVDPGGSLDRYRAAADHLLTNGVRHIVGCYTSSSRKEIIPSLEKFDGLLWYPSHYEGFESSPNVIYTGAAPNQHVVPLANWALPRYGGRTYCIGSNYIWAWENTRIMRDLVQSGGGTILRERYLPIGSTDVRAAIREISESAPDFVFNTLIGESCYAFYRAYHELAQHDERFLPTKRPILSCSLSEPELHAIGPGVAAGHIAASVYFQSITSTENVAFVRTFRERFGGDRVTSADSEAAYMTMLLLAASLHEAKTDQLGPVKQAAYACRLSAPQGDMWVDPENNHAWLTPRIGTVTAEGSFEIQWEASTPYRPDPYLAFSPKAAAVANGMPRRGGPQLRLVRCQ